MNRFIIVCFAVLSIGCSATFSEKELIEAGVPMSFCHSEDFERTLVKVRDRLNKCYAGNINISFYAAGAIYSRSSDRTVEEKRNNQETIFVHKEGNYYGFRVTLKSESSLSCKTRVDAHVMNSFWKVHITRLERYLSGEELSCRF